MHFRSHRRYRTYRERPVGSGGRVAAHGLSVESLERRGMLSATVGMPIDPAVVAVEPPAECVVPSAEFGGDDAGYGVPPGTSLLLSPAIAWADPGEWNADLASLPGDDSYDDWIFIDTVTADTWTDWCGGGFTLSTLEEISATSDAVDIIRCYADLDTTDTTVVRWGFDGDDSFDGMDTFLDEGGWDDEAAWDAASWNSYGWTEGGWDEGGWDATYDVAYDTVTYDTTYDAGDLIGEGSLPRVHYVVSDPHWAAYYYMVDGEGVVANLVVIASPDEPTVAAFLAAHGGDEGVQVFPSGTCIVVFGFPLDLAPPVPDASDVAWRVHDGTDSGTLDDTWSSDDSGDAWESGEPLFASGREVQRGFQIAVDAGTDDGRTASAGRPSMDLAAAGLWMNLAGVEVAGATLPGGRKRSR